MAQSLSVRGLFRARRDGSYVAVSTGYALLALALMMAVVCGVALGAYAIPLPRLGDALLMRAGEGLAAADVHVLWSIRLPRVLLAVICGAALALGGCALQGLFRNPLADPGLIGLSAGAALAAALAIVLGGQLFGPLARSFGLYLIPAAALLGAALAAWLILRLASHHGRTSVLMLLLAGIAINALCGAIIGGLQFVANDDQLRNLTFWTLGSLAQGRWPVVAITAAALGLGGVVLWRLRLQLDALNLGESAAYHLGVDVQRLKLWLLAAVTLMVGVSVAFTGIIGFIGLVAPHIVRTWLGPSHRHALLASALLGAVLLVSADLAARTWVAPAEMPVGVLTSLLGTPFFLMLLARRRHGFD